MGGVKRYIITGPPGSGKTTLIERLSEKGFGCMPEVSRQVIRSEQEHHRDGTPWGDLVRFTRLVFDRTLDALHQNSGFYFCDRGLPDNVAYLKDAGLEVPLYLSQLDFQAFYQPLAFYCPPWKEIYRTDPQRPGRFEGYENLDRQLRATYHELGFRLIVLSHNSIEERINFILDRLELNKILYISG